MIRRTSLALLLAGCAPHERPAPEAEPPLAALARSLGLELPDCAGPDRPLGGRAVWISQDGVYLVDGAAGRKLVTLAQGVPTEAPGNHMLGALYDALTADGPPSEAFDVDVLADRRVPLSTVVDVLYTLGRAGGHGYRFVCGSVDRPSAVSIAPRTFGAIERDPPQLRELRGDLALTWGDDGVRAWALPRPAEHPPFPAREEDLVDSELPAPSRLPARVPLVLSEGTDPPLAPGDVARLAASLCRFNDAPMGVVLEAQATTSYPDLLATAVAATTRCSGPRELFFAVDPAPRTGPLTVGGLRTLAR